MRITSGVSAPFAAPIDSNTRYCAVFGHPVRHSASPAMQNAGLAALGLNWRYLAFDVEPSQLARAIVGAKTMGFVGLNLTLPHKLLAVDLIETLDPNAKIWGAVNTIVFEGRDGLGDWNPVWSLTPTEVRARGFNTDADAIIQSLREDLAFEPAGRRVLLLGAGGAGRVAALRLAAAKVAELYLVNRTSSKAAELAREIGVRFPGPSVQVGYPAGEVDLVLNATSLGLKRDDPLPLDRAQFPLRKAGAVYDMIYRPAETPLLKAAKAAGCRSANGLGMLLHQGTRALELWSGMKAPITVMRHALVQNIYGS
jgi:shikimate dehydrogenase